MIRYHLANYKHFGKCLYATNGIVEVIAACEFGIRIVSFSLCGGANVFFEQPESMEDLTTEQGWRIYGGHRVWVSPESDRDYFPDNAPVFFEVWENMVILRQQEDPWLNVIKEITLRFTSGSKLEVVHRITNCREEMQELSVWAISSLCAGGVEKIFLKPDTVPWGPRLCLTLWDYADLNDDRVEYKREYIKLCHKPKDGKKFKLGIADTAGRYEYRNQGVVFTKYVCPERVGRYPDQGMSFETFMCDHMLEMETLSPLLTIEKNETISHDEIWDIGKEI